MFTTSCRTGPLQGPTEVRLLRSEAPLYMFVPTGGLVGLALKVQRFLAIKESCL